MQNVTGKGEIILCQLLDCLNCEEVYHFIIINGRKGWQMHLINKISKIITAAKEMFYFKIRFKHVKQKRVGFWPLMIELLA